MAHMHQNGVCLCLELLKITIDSRESRRPASSRAELDEAALILLAPAIK